MHPYLIILVYKPLKRKSVQINIVLRCCDGVQALANFGQVRHLEEKSIPPHFKGIHCNLEATNDDRCNTMHSMHNKLYVHEMLSEIGRAEVHSATT